MIFGIDSATLLYALGILFALVAFLYFAKDLVFSLSVPTKAGLLCCCFLAFLTAGVAIGSGVLEVVAVALAAIAYGVLVYYLLDNYDPGETAVFLTFAASASLFLLLGYVFGQLDPTVAPWTAGAVGAGIVAVAVTLVVGDSRIETRFAP